MARRQLHVGYLKFYISEAYVQINNSPRYI